MAIFNNQILQLYFFVAILILFVGIANSEEIFQEWHVKIDRTISPVSIEQPVILINGKFPGPLIKATTNNMIHINVFNDMVPLELTIVMLSVYHSLDLKMNLTFSLETGKTYRFRKSNVGNQWSFNFRIQNHHMLVVETEGSYTNQIMVDSLDVHVGQSYSVLVTADQKAADYYVVATPKMANTTKYGNLVGVGVLHYLNSSTMATGPLPRGPDPYDLQYSINQAKSIKWNMTTGAARPNPQGTFNVTNVTLSQTFILTGSRARNTNGFPYYTVNDVWYTETDTPLKLADLMTNGSGVYELDEFSTNSSNGNLRHGVYPKTWTAVYAYLDNPGMWNLRSQCLKNWYLGQQLYLRVYDADDPNPAQEKPPPDNLLLCGAFGHLAPPPPPSSTSVTSCSC
ncbi:hypothetical protein NC652_020295 [Populus alba x Populus x berolinensis]|nr:hypothetical protein NC652_020291 [Populus alba x Populus x berolinensis]KAJ6909261.1 hypothetical protein NC652_020295 [Populus alba x Populus x berolinensis]